MDITGSSRDIERFATVVPFQQRHGLGEQMISVGEAAELREAAKRAVARLPENYRQVIQLIQGEGLTTAAAAERLGRTTDSVKGLYSRALARLARELNLDKDTE